MQAICQLITLIKVQPGINCRTIRAALVLCSTVADIIQAMCTCDKRGERLRNRAQLVADRATDGGCVLRQARRLRAARILRQVKERHLLRGSLCYVTKLV